MLSVHRGPDSEKHLSAIDFNELKVKQVFKCFAELELSCLHDMNKLLEECPNFESGESIKSFGKSNNDCSQGPHFVPYVSPLVTDGRLSIKDSSTVNGTI